MSTPKQFLQVDPENELHFKGPFHLPSAAFLRLTNISDKKVLFKIKTTAPKKYCVRPNSGLLFPDKYVDIVLSLQPFSYDPSEKNKHKFLIQSTEAPNGDEIDMEEVWRTIQAEEIIENKLRCVFEVPNEPKVHCQVNTNSVVIKTQNNSDSYEASQEMKHLKDEQIQIKEENVRLKEEILQLKKDIEATVLPPSSTVSVKDESRVSSLAFVVVSGMFLGVIGFVLGKYGF